MGEEVVMTAVLRQKDVKIRKSHKCFGCGLMYNKGETMMYSSYADEGTISNCYWCKTCQEYIYRHIESGDSIMQNEIYDNDPEGWHEIFEELKSRKVE